MSITNLQDKVWFQHDGAKAHKLQVKLHEYLRETFPEQLIFNRDDILSQKPNLANFFSCVASSLFAMTLPVYRKHKTTIFVTRGPIRVKMLEQVEQNF